MVILVVMLASLAPPPPPPPHQKNVSMPLLLSYSIMVLRDMRIGLIAVKDSPAEQGSIVRRSVLAENNPGGFLERLRQSAIYELVRGVTS